MSTREERTAALEPQDENDLKMLGTLVETKWWGPLKKVLQRIENNGTEDAVDPQSSIATIAQGQGKVQVARDLLDLLERVAPSAYLKALERERIDTRDE